MTKGMRMEFTQEEIAAVYPKVAETIADALVEAVDAAEEVRRVEPVVRGLAAAAS